MEYQPLKVELVKSNSSPLVRPILNFGNQRVVSTLEKSMPSTPIKSYLEPPLQLMDAMGYKAKPSALTYSLLYAMSTKNSVVGAVINTRVNQISAFTKPHRYSSDKTGFEIKLKNPNAEPSDEQKRTIAAMEAFIENCGFNKDASRDNFDTFIRKITRDSLTYDQTTFEIIKDRRGKPAEFIAVDAATIRAATEDFEIRGSMDVAPPKKGEEVKWVQVIDESIVSWFTSSELAFGVRNPRTNIYTQPYGFSELEQLITQITSHLYAEEYNSKFFSQGGTTKGIINLKSDPNGIANQQELNSFKRQWRAQVTGLTGAWKTPVLQVPNGIEYINVSQSNREMEFEKWMNYLINIVCAIYQIDPSEVNFPNNGGVGGTGGGVFESSNEAKLKNSKDKGLRPLLRFIETMINKYLIANFSDDYVFNFVGIDSKTEEEQLELDTKMLKAYKTVNEVRIANGIDPLEKYGDVLLDPSWLNYYQQQEMMNSQSSDTGDFSDTGYEDEETDEDMDETSSNSSEADYGADTEEDTLEDEGTQKSIDADLKKAQEQLTTIILDIE